MTSFLNPTFLISILIALSVHEASHGWVARRLGDPTAENEGRVTLNPIAHLDPLGTILFLFVGFGWGKPVPVNPVYFRHPKRDTALVSLAGPVSNLLLATLSFALLALLYPGAASSVGGLLSSPSSESIAATFLRSLLQSLLFINLALMAFNLLPVAPLDGSKVLAAFIPWQHEERYNEWMRRGPFVLLFLLVAESLLNVPFLSGWISWLMGGTLSLLQLLFGWL
ncbi:MAG: site-2 protease family protein [Candidatus Peribacteraceae bacterium]|nr:site-2 protease family protein [Candidatus Peribacteraceae bacterium]